MSNLAHTESSLLWHLLPISAKSKDSLARATEQLAEQLEKCSSSSFDNLVHTLQANKKQLIHRRIAVSWGPIHAAGVLRTLDKLLCGTGEADGTERSIGFMFSGQGNQYTNMCRGLYESEPIFKETLDKCATVISDSSDINILEYLFTNNNNDKVRNINETSIAQPALYAVECGLALLWKHYGINPKVLIGHSIGEFSAAFVSGVFTLEDGARIVSARGKYMQQMRPGKMLAVLLPEGDVKLHMNGDLEIALVNGPSLNVVSGSEKYIDKFENTLLKKGIQSRQLYTSHAFHSKMMEDAVGMLVDEMKKYTLKKPSIPFISNVTGDWITSEQATDPNYWGIHLRSTVKFGVGLETLCAKENLILLEVGPGNTLSTIARQQVKHVKSMPVINSVRHVKQQCDDQAYLMRAFGMIWAYGANVDFFLLESEKI
jgi:acyl transferase domain-containing protein